MSPLLMRDLRLALRQGGGAGLALAFYLLVIILVPFGVGAEADLLSRLAPGMLWVGALLSCLLTLERLFQLDYEDGTLDALATSPLPLEAVALAKALAHWLTTGLPLALIAPLLGVMLKLPDEGYGALTLSLLLGTPALSLIGAFCAALTVGVKRGGLLLSLLVLPLYVPTLIFGARAASDGGDFTALLMLAGVSLLSLAILPVATAAALRANLR